MSTPVKVLTPLVLPPILSNVGSFNKMGANFSIPRASVNGVGRWYLVSSSQDYQSYVEGYVSYQLLGICSLPSPFGVGLPF
jgi:hypothetical protein